MNKTSYTNVSSDDVKDRRNNVEMLWLDAVEHKLQKELAELQDTTIDKNCIGCWQKLDECRKLESIRVQCDTELIDKLHMEIHNQKKLIDELNYRNTRLTAVKDTLYYRSEEQQNTIDEYRETVKNLENTIEGIERDLSICKGSGTANDLYIAGLKKDIESWRQRNGEKDNIIIKENHWIAGMDTEIKKRDTVIDELKESIRLERIDHVTAKEAIVSHLNGKITSMRTEYGIEQATDHDAIRTLNQHIIGLEAELSSMKHNYEIILQNRRNRCDKLEDNIKGLEAELSARKGDSEVLMKVVDVIRRWGDERIPSRSAMNQIAYVTKDYLNAPEPPIEEEHCITVNVPTTEHVQPIIDELLRGLKQHGSKVKVEFNVPDGVFLELP